MIIELESKSKKSSSVKLLIKVLMRFNSDLLAADDELQNSNNNANIKNKRFMILFKILFNTKEQE